MNGIRIPKIWILLAVFIVSVAAAGAWVFTTPPDYISNQTGDYFGDYHQDGQNVTADKFNGNISVGSSAISSSRTEICKIFNTTPTFPAFNTTCVFGRFADYEFPSKGSSSSMLSIVYNTTATTGSPWTIFSQIDTPNLVDTTGATALYGKAKKGASGWNAGVHGETISTATSGTGIGINGETNQTVAGGEAVNLIGAVGMGCQNGSENATCWGMKSVVNGKDSWRNPGGGLWITQNSGNSSDAILIDTPTNYTHIINFTGGKFIDYDSANLFLVLSGLSFNISKSNPAVRLFSPSQNNYWLIQQVDADGRLRFERGTVEYMNISTAGRVEITNNLTIDGRAKGINMTSPDGTIYCFSVANGGTAAFASGGCK